MVIYKIMNKKDNNFNNSYKIIKRIDERYNFTSTRSNFDSLS